VKNKDSKDSKDGTNSMSSEQAPSPKRSNDGAGRERRRHTRFKVAPMYTRVRVTAPETLETPAAEPAIDDASDHDGHIYDISEGGVRFELDEPLPEGKRVGVEIHLPGCRTLIRAYGKIVRVNDAADDPGPRRMALRFDTFVDEESKSALRRYLGEGWLEAERAA
jgi:hypothetical protein